VLCLIFLPWALAHAQDSGAPARKAVQPAPGLTAPPGKGLSTENNEAGAMQSEESSPTNPKPLVWDGKDPQARCEGYLPRLKDAYGQTMASSFRNAGCSTVRSANAFLDLVETCKEECPDGFLESRGYSRRAIYKVYAQGEIGRKRCPSSVAETGPGSQGSLSAGQQPAGSEESAGKKSE
jgi:hypothetical protein